MFLRFKNQPLDLTPDFDPETFMYTATLDWAMDSFSVDAFATPGCVPDKVPFRAIPVPKGETYEIEIFAKVADEDQKQPYAISVRRLEGTETELEGLRVLGGVLLPHFAGDLRRYTAELQVGHDLVRFAYILRDSGQKIRFTATSQAVDESRMRQLASGVEGNPPVLVQRSGELQRVERYESFPIDHGHKRVVTIAIESADPMNARDGSYIVDVSRSACNVSRPLYDPLSQTCVINCGAGYYGNEEARRCSRCNTHCAVCSGVSRCELCERDTSRHRFVVQPDGSCGRLATSLAESYGWWCASLGLLLAVAVCAGLAPIFACVYAACCGASPRERADGLFSMDSDAEPFESERLLG